MIGLCKVKGSLTLTFYDWVSFVNASFGKSRLNSIWLLSQCLIGILWTSFTSTLVQLSWIIGKYKGFILLMYFNARCLWPIHHVSKIDFSSITNRCFLQGLNQFNVLQKPSCTSHRKLITTMAAARLMIGRIFFFQVQITDLSFSHAIVSQFSFIGNFLLRRLKEKKEHQMKIVCEYQQLDTCTTVQYFSNCQF